MICKIIIIGEYGFLKDVTYVFLVRYIELANLFCSLQRNSESNIIDICTQLIEEYPRIVPRQLCIYHFYSSEFYFIPFVVCDYLKFGTVF